MKKRITMIFKVVAVILFVVFISALVWAYLDITHDYKSARAELIELLKSSDEVNTLETIVEEREAAILHFSTNAWMAILYIDNHGPGHPSTIVVRCSDNKWFYTHNGEYSSTGLWWEYLGRKLELDERVEQSRPEVEVESIKVDLRRYWPYLVEEQPTLGEAKKYLLELGFKKLKTP